MQDPDGFFGKKCKSFIHKNKVADIGQFRPDHAEETANVRINGRFKNGHGSANKVFSVFS